MSEHYPESNHHINDVNYTALENTNNENEIILDTIIAIFGAIIGIQLLVFSYYFRVIIRNFCCKRHIRNFDGMVQLGEITHTVEKEEEELLED